MQNNRTLSKIIIDASTGASFEQPLTVGEIAQIDRDLKESQDFINSINNRKQQIDSIKQKIISGEKLTEQEVTTLFGE